MTSFNMNQQQSQQQQQLSMTNQFEVQIYYFFSENQFEFKQLYFSGQTILKQIILKILLNDRWTAKIYDCKQQISWKDYATKRIDDMIKHHSNHNLLKIHCVKKQTNNQYTKDNQKLIINKVQLLQGELETKIRDMEDYESLNNNLKRNIDESLKMICSCTCNVCERQRLRNSNQWANAHGKTWYDHLIWYKSKTQTERRIYIISMLQHGRNDETMLQKNLNECEFNCFFNVTCVRVFQWLHFMSSQCVQFFVSRFRQRLKHLGFCWNARNLEKIKLKMQFVIPPHPKKDLCVAFWKYYLSLFGEWAPNLKEVRIATQKRLDIYKIDFSDFCKENQCPDTQGIGYVSFPYFMHTLYELQSVHRVRWTDKRRFTLCSVCSDIHRGIMYASGKQEKEKVHLLKYAHLEHIKLIRHYVLSKEIESYHLPWKSAVIVADGMDQSVLNFPFAQRMSKENASRSLQGCVKFWLFCFLSSFGTKYCFFYKNGQTRKGVNCMVTCLLLWLLNACANLKPIENNNNNNNHNNKNNHWPKELYVVLDNGPENRGTNFLLFLSVLFYYGLFCKIQVIYLPVGHTHWKVDQSFSVIRQHLRNEIRGVDSMKDFTNYLQNFDNKECYVKFVEQLYDWRQVILYLRNNIGEKYADLTFKENITSFFNFDFQNMTKIRQNGVIINASKKSLNYETWKNIKTKASLTYFNNKINEMKDYYQYDAGDWIKDIFNKVNDYWDDVEISNTSIIEWPTFDILENTMITPMEPLVKLNYAKIQNYLQNFGLDRVIYEEWQALLQQFQSYESKCCNICLTYFTKSKNKAFYAECSKNFGDNKDRLGKIKDQLLDHLIQTDFHRAENIKKNENNVFQIFQVLRIVKREIQNKLKQEQTDWKIDDKKGSVPITQDCYHFFSVSQETEKQIQKDIFTKCNMFTSTTHQVLTALNLMDDWQKKTKTRINIDFQMVEEQLKKDFFNCLYKNNKYKEYEVRKFLDEDMYFREDEISSIINLKQLAVFELNKDTIPGTILIVSNTIGDILAPYEWFLFYFVGSVQQKKKCLIMEYYLTH